MCSVPLRECRIPRCGATAHRKKGLIIAVRARYPAHGLDQGDLQHKDILDKTRTRKTADDPVQSDSIESTKEESHRNSQAMRTMRRNRREDRPDRPLYVVAVTIMIPLSVLEYQRY